MDNSGLAFEAAEALTQKNGISAAVRQIGRIKVTDVRISEPARKRTGKQAGRYITLEGEPSDDGMTALLRRALTQLIPPKGRLFAAGLGNPDITQDSLGAVCVRGLTARRGTRYSLAAIETDVAVKTGLDTARLVKAAAAELRADCVIVIDALACRNPRYIGKTVQLCDAGLIPGSGADSAKGALSRENLGVPVIAAGVPTVTGLSSVTKAPEDRGFLVTTSDIDVVIKMWAEVIGGAVDSIVG